MAIATTDRTDEQRAICEMVRQFADEQILPNAEHYDHEDEFPEPIVEQMKELGLFGVTIPEEFDGMGLDLSTYAMIVEELSRGWISISGIVPPTVTSTSSAPWSRSSSSTRGTRVMCAPERIDRPTASASSWIAVSAIGSGV